MVWKCIGFREFFTSQKKQLFWSIAHTIEDSLSLYTSLQERERERARSR